MEIIAEAAVFVTFLAAPRLMGAVWLVVLGLVWLAGGL